MTYDCASAPMPELKPCPFCGEEAERTEKTDDGLYGVRCHNPYCIGRDIFPAFYVKKNAIKAWNRRANEK